MAVIVDQGLLGGGQTGIEFALLGQQLVDLGFGFSGELLVKVDFLLALLGECFEFIANFLQVALNFLVLVFHGS